MTTQEIKDLLNITELPESVDETLLEQMPDEVKIRYVGSKIN